MRKTRLNETRDGTAGRVPHDVSASASASASLYLYNNRRPMKAKRIINKYIKDEIKY